MMGVREVIAFTALQWASQAAVCYCRAAQKAAQTDLDRAKWGALEQVAANVNSAAGIGLAAAGPEFTALQASQQAVIDQEKTAVTALAGIPAVTCGGPGPGGPAPTARGAEGEGHAATSSAPAPKKG